MDTVTYRAHNDADLELPLDRALDEAVQSGKQWFHLILAPGSYKIQSLNLRESTLSFRVECEGDAPAVFHDAAFDFEGPNIEIRNVVIDGGSSQQGTLRIRVSESAMVERVAILNAKVGWKDTDSSALEIYAPRTRARATLRDVWLVGNETYGEGGILGFPKRGPGRIETVDIERLVFANNKAPMGVKLTWSETVSFRDITVIEPQLEGPWLMLRNSTAAIRIDGGFMAVSKKVLGYQPTSDTKLSEFSDVIANHVEFRGSAGVGERIKGEGNTFKPAVGHPRDWGFITKPARAAAVPDRTALASRLP